MNITYWEDYAQMSVRAAALVLAEITQKPNLLLCAATGHSPAGLYEELVEHAASNPALFGQLRVVKLDEWGGVSPQSPISCEHYLQTRLVQPLRIAPERYLSFRSEAADPAEECQRVQEALDQVGPLDVCILGIGQNGHLALNEPHPTLEPLCHVAQLSDTTLHHPMFQGEAAPSFGLTLGMQALLQARKVILLVAGAHKEQAREALLSGKITTALPASFLWLHRDVECLVVKA
ncbi:galactosamine-6-phosphate isomerase [Catalinimonas alkaloidigena]|uniref:Galactosamine-6-phosphate isomerase n=1 Tax=Catalinimonas alkaloidigena TaxID=1075417 RepID=A0A1G8ZTC8_9BACT|nr:galactosamine-6-phosphate isomerase [Catalinimonas alkaloidigena]SDK18376.1 galactosamine-6-phosphate isomerase [Catalinimonas alkaloidigena]